MSATVRSGLIFGLVGLVAVIIVSFVPLIGALLCGPGTALIVGGLAGYFALRWSATPAGVGQGALAAAIAGVGILIGTVLFIIVSFSLIQNDPSFQNILDQAIQQQLDRQPDVSVSAEDMAAMVRTFVPITGFCFGIINLVIALVGGLLGALIGRRTPAAPPAPPAVPPIA